ncbi:FHA domain-containing protein [Archangium lansingense]|uniref:FHA domain-containing protein n=1 Tax=Archangium lansingense TaxID=2995310 RepID=UPI003B7D763D
MSVRLTVKQSSEAGGKPTEFVLDDAVITLGRDKACQVVLAQQAVSRSHARITQEGNLFFLEDLGSAYGTQVNGKQLPKGEKRLLRNGDVIVIAQFDVRFDKVAELPHDVESQKTSFVARNMVKDVMRGLSGGEERYLRVMNGPREGERLEVNDAQEFIIGRDDSADVVFRDDLISRQHVKVRRDWSGTHVEDLGSRNGIKVNRKRTNRKTLKDGDELEVGGVRFVYVCPSEAPEEQSEALSVPIVASTSENSSSSTHPLPAARERTSSVKRSATSTEKPAEAEAEPEQEAEASSSEPAAEEPAAAPAEQEAAAEPEPPVEEPVRPAPPPPVRRSEPEDDVSDEKDIKRYIPLVALGVIFLMAVGVLIALFVGA